MSLIDGFVRAVPKVQLHLHLVGSASPHAVAALVAEIDQVEIDYQQ